MTSPLHGALLYLLLGAAWVLGGDALVSAWLPDREAVVAIQAVKGSAYIALTAAVAWWLLRRVARAEREMRQSERDLRQLFEQAEVGMGILAADGRWLKVNQRLAQLLDRPVEALLAGDAGVLRRPGGGDAAPAPHWSLMRPGVALDAPVWLTVSATPLRDAAGAVTRELVVVSDVTAAHLAERQRRDSEARLQQIIRTIPDPLCVKDLEGRCRTWNPAFERLAGGDAAAIEGRTDEEIFGTEFGARLRALDLEVLRTGMARQEEVTLQPPHGTARQLSATRAPFLDAVGRTVGVLGIAHDVTAQAEALQRVRDAEGRTLQLLVQAQASRRALLSVVEDHQHAEAALRESQARLDAMLSALPDLILLWGESGECLDLWAGAGVKTRLPRARMVGRRVEELVGPAMVTALRAAMASAAVGAAPVVVEYRLPEADPPRWLEVRVMRVNALRWLTLTRDVTERHLHDERQRLFTAVFEHTQEAVMITDPDWNILSVNRAFTALLGYGEDEVRGRSASLLRTPDQPRHFRREMVHAVHADGQWKGETWSRHKNGESVPFLLSIGTVRDAAGRPAQLVLLYTDISRIKRSEAELLFLAHHDPLTRLPNRLLFQGRLEQAVADAQRHGQSCAVLMLDLDHFKNVNDSYGHLAGDELLQQVAQRLGQRLRRIDTLARLGGDEFALLLEDIRRPEDAARLAGELITALAQPLRLGNGAEVTIGVSIGISLYPDHGGTPQALMQGADAALYHAKGAGRGALRFFTDEMTRLTRERLELEQRLRRAVAEGQLRLHYQPQVDIRSGAIVGAEALVRWEDPNEGLVPPMRFIPVAEATGLIADIGLWVLHEACRQGRAWIDAGLPPITMAVNVSPRQFHRGDLAAQVTQVLLETGFPPERLELEVTESALMERESDALDMLQRLRGLGVGVAIDDFGTGYSSLAYLRRFPLDVLKIDRSFIAEVPRQADDMEIASAIIAMGHSLGIKVLAEGVETEAQLDFLRLKGCDRYQGFLRSKPLPAPAFEALWTDGR